MAPYRLCFDRLDGDARIRPLTIEGETPAGLAQAVHRHARGYLGSRSVDIHLDEDTLTGSVLRNSHVVGEFTLTPAQAAQPQPEQTSSAPGHIRHGRTLDDVDRIAWGVATSDRWHAGTPLAERHDHARHGIVVHLLSADQPPADYDLYRAGLAEITRAVHAEIRFKGHQDTADERGEFGFLPQAARYWNPPAASPLEERIVERIALHQVWPLLTGRQRQALAALAACGDYQQAADALDLNLKAFDMRLAKGRSRLAAVWFEHETPPKRRGKDRRVSTRSGRDSAGRPRVTVSQLEQVRTRRARGELLRDIAPDYGITRQALGRLLRGVHQPAPDPVPVGEAA